MTTPERQVMSLFGEAVEYGSPEERAAFLDEACAGDAGRRARVEALLRAYEAAGQFLHGHTPTTGPAATAEEPPQVEAGAVIGPYKLLEQIGEGGMGSVWMAQQTEPVRRLVAVKLIKAGMGSRQIVARFEAERQALALMDHANIAKVLDAGTTGAGRPYFVMDLVMGVPITRYCDENRLTPRQRLELMVPVCTAVQHAHQKGVIHRDLKPSNVLIANYDGVPVPKLIDFGVAKAAGGQFTEEALHTGFGTVIGTVEYMSPEQATLNALDVDTRSDIYSLGVILYELLTGTTPLERARVQEAGLLEALRVIREEDTQRPSARLSTVQELPGIAAARGVEPKKLGGLVRGELDWIVMKALDKDRSRRYETANAFALDLQRYLAGEAVQAVPPTRGYRLRKFARRNKPLLTGTAVVGAAVLLAVVSLAVSYSRIAQKQQETNNALATERQAKDELRRAAYDLRLALARHGWLAGQVEQAKRHIEDCPPDLRDQEWRYLHRACHAEVRRFAFEHGKHSLGPVAYSPDGRWLAARVGRATVKVWDARTWRERTTLELDALVAVEIAFSRDGKELLVKTAPYATKPKAVGLIHGADVIAWDVPGWALKRVVRFPRQPFRSMFTPYKSSLSPDGAHLAVAEQKEVLICSCLTGKTIFRVPMPDGKTGANGVVCRPDGRGFALSAGTKQDFLRLWDSSKGWTVVPDNRYPGLLTYSPDGRLFACAYHKAGMTDSEILVWDVGRGRERITLRGPQRWLTCLTFSPDGQHLASGSMENTLLVWDVATGREVFSFRGHTRQLHALAFRGDGHRLASTSDDLTVRVWDSSPLEGPR